jgi:hypothetical protein
MDIKRRAVQLGGPPPEDITIAVVNTPKRDTRRILCPSHLLRNVGTLVFVSAALLYMFRGYASELVCSSSVTEVLENFSSDAPVLTDKMEGEVTTSTTTSNLCAQMLDKLDIAFDNRRKPRQSGDRGWTGLRLFDLFEPEATCISEERFGSDSEERFDAFGDGPKFLCGVDYLAAKAMAGSAEDSTACLIYSVGSNNDIRFEKAVRTHMYGCEVHTFDPTLGEDAFIGGEYATFHSWGLGTDGGKEGSAMGGRNNTGIRKSFKTVIKDLGHENRTIDVLKVRQFYLYAALAALFNLPQLILFFNSIMLRLIVKGVSMPPCPHCST